MFQESILLRVLLLMTLVMALILDACVPPPPDHPQNICSIYSQYPEWFWASEDTYKKWGLPDYVLMAIINQESSFEGKAKPPRRHILWIIPWKRISTAKGYSQALNGTWEGYEKNQHHSASRTNFGDASDFIGWYANLAYREDAIPEYNTYELYLAYHEGLGGYVHHSYDSKAWLIYVAKKVANTSEVYHYQLSQCISRLPQPSKSWW